MEKPNAILGNAKRIYACTVDADESTRPRLEGAGHKPLQDHIIVKGMNFITHCSLVHKFIPMPQAWKIQCKGGSGERMEKTDENPGMATDESQKQERSDRWSNKGHSVHFSSLMDLCHVKNSELQSQYQKYKDRVVLRGDIVKDDSDSFAVLLNRDHQHFQWQPQKSWILYQDFQDFQDKQQMQYPLILKSKLKMHQRYSKIPTISEATNDQNHGPLGKIQSFPLNDSCTVTIRQDSYMKSTLRKFCCNTIGKSFKLGMFLCQTSKKTILISISVCGRHQTGTQDRKQKKKLGKFSWRTLIRENQHHFLTMFIWVALKESVKSAKILWRTTEICSNPGFLLEPRKNYLPEFQWNLMQKQYFLGLMTWKVAQRNVWKDIANLRVKQFNN